MDKFWVGGAGDWSDATNHWSLTSGGTPGVGNLPTASDDVFFDDSSGFVDNDVITIDVNAVCHNFTTDFSLNNTVGVSFLMDSFTLNVSGSFTNGWIFWDNSVNGTLLFSTTEVDVPINSWTSPSKVEFNGTGNWILENDIYTLSEDYTTLFSVELIKGDLDVNGSDIKASVFSSTGSNVRSLTMSGGEIQVFGDGTTSDHFEISGTNITVNAADGRISLGDYDSTDEVNFLGGENEYGTLSVLSPITATIKDSNTFNTFNINEGGVILQFADGTTTTIIDADNSIISGQSDLITIQPLTIKSVGTGFHEIIATTGVINGQYLVLENSHASGGATFNALDSIDNGGNTGWNITAPVLAGKFWVGGMGSWSQATYHWATESGGVPDVANTPTATDNVFFDANSGLIDGDVITINTPAECQNLYCQITGTIPLVMNLTNTLSVSGSFDGAFFNCQTTTGTLEFLATGDLTIGRLPSALVVNIPVGFLRVPTLNAPHCDVTLTSGQFALNDGDIIIESLTSTGSLERSLSFGSSNILVLDGITVSGTNFSNSISTSAQGITLGYGGVPSFLYGNGDYWGKVTIAPDAMVDIYGDNTFRSLTIGEGSTLRFNDGTNTLINAPIECSLVLTGASTTTLKSIGTDPHYLQTVSGEVVADYLTIQSSYAYGGTFTAGENSIDGGGNTGWVFTIVPPEELVLSSSLSIGASISKIVKKNDLSSGISLSSSGISSSKINTREINVDITLSPYDATRIIAEANANISTNASKSKYIKKAEFNEDIAVSADPVSSNRTTYASASDEIILSTEKVKAVGTNKNVEVNISSLKNSGLIKEKNLQISLSSEMSFVKINAIDTRTVSVGKNNVAEIIGGLRNDVFNYIHIGDNNTGLSGENTTLLGEFSSFGLEPRIGIATKSGERTVNISAVFTATEEKIVKEVGLFSGIGASTLLSRTTLRPIYLDANDSVTVNYKISIIV